jgi:RNA polymerase sigma-70 factor (ECF subfamily)
MSARPTAAEGIDLGALRERRPEAVDTWFRRYADPVYTFAFYRVGRDAATAEDVVQDVFLTALRKLDSFDPERGAMLTWLQYIARTCLHEIYRKRRRYDTHAEFWDGFDRRLAAALSRLGAAPLPDEVLEREETAELVRAALSNLPEHYQEALRDRYHEERPLREIAASRGMTEGAVKSLLHRARLAFRAALEELAAAVEGRAPGGEAIP